MVQMKSTQGTVVSVSEEKAKRLRSAGYTEVRGASSNGDGPKKRGRPKKATAEEKSLEDMTWDDEAGG